VQSAHEAFVDYLRHKGLKVTQQRLRILNTILQTSRAHFNAEDLHDHMICNLCGRIIEFSSGELEALQDKLCREQGFTPESHVLHIRGICRVCAAKQGKSRT